MKVCDVQPFHISGEANVFVRDDYKNNVELPGLAACLHLYDLNIQTTWFNCNKEDPNVDLHFAFSTLSDENKEIAKELEKDGLIKIDYNHGICYIRFNATVNDDVEEISNRLLDIVKHFSYQDILYGYRVIDDRFLYENFIQFGIAAKEELNNKEYLKELIEGYLGCYFDEENNLAWSNEELYQKHQDYKENQKKGELK